MTTSAFRPSFVGERWTDHFLHLWTSGFSTSVISESFSNCVQIYFQSFPQRLSPVIIMNGTMFTTIVQLIYSGNAKMTFYEILFIFLLFFSCTFNEMWLIVDRKNTSCLFLHLFFLLGCDLHRSLQVCIVYDRNSMTSTFVQIFSSCCSELPWWCLKWSDNLVIQVTKLLKMAS